MPCTAHWNRSIVVLCLLAGAGEALLFQTDNASIAGIILDRSTGSPLRKALVTLSTEEPRPLDAQAITDGAGRFAFSNVPPGRYQLHADCKGYQRAWYGAASANHGPGILTLDAGESRRDLALRLEPLSAVSGVVVDQDGDPLSDVTVHAWVQVFWRGKRRFFERRLANTNDRGQYRIYDLVAGSYFLMADGRQLQAFRIHPEVAASKQPAEQARFGARFYPGTDRISAASALALAPGKEIEGIDFHMSPILAATLKGRVIPPVELPPDSQIHVTITPQDVPDQEGDGFSFGVPPPNYAFEQYGLVSAEYLVVANLSLGGHQYRGVHRVVMRSGAENEITLTLDPGIELSGSLKIEGDGGGNPGEYRVGLSSGDMFPLNGPAPQTRPNADGSFVLTSVVPGIWDIGVNPIPPGGYIKSMRLGEQDVLTEDMLIGPGTSAPLRIVVSTRGGILEGNVKKVSGEDAGRAIVLLAPVGGYSHVLSFFSPTFADEAGHFKLTGLTPASYRLYAFEAMEYAAWQDPEFLKPFEDLGEIVEIDEGINASRNIQLIPTARSPQ